MLLIIYKNGRMIPLLSKPWKGQKPKRHFKWSSTYTSLLLVSSNLWKKYRNLQHNLSWTMALHVSLGQWFISQAPDTASPIPGALATPVSAAHRPGWAELRTEAAPARAGRWAGKGWGLQLLFTFYTFCVSCSQRDEESKNVDNKQTSQKRLVPTWRTS